MHNRAAAAGTGRKKIPLTAYGIKSFKNPEFKIIRRRKISASKNEKIERSRLINEIFFLSIFAENI